MNNHFYERPCIQLQDKFECLISYIFISKAALFQYSHYESCPPFHSRGYINSMFMTLWVFLILLALGHKTDLENTETKFYF